MSEIRVKLTGDSSEYRSMLSESEKHTASALGGMEGKAVTLKSAFQSIGVTLKGAGIGLFVAQLVNLGKEAITGAQKTRDEFQAAGKSVDGATRSLAALGDGLKDVRVAAVNTVGFILGGWTQIGDLIGSGINRLRGISEAQENIAAATQVLADAQERRTKQLQAEQHNVEAIARARKELAAFEESSNLKALEGNEKVNALMAQNVKIRQQLQNTEENTVAFFERKKLLQENINALTEIEKKERAEAAKQQKESDAAADKAAEKYLSNVDKLAALRFEALSAQEKIVKLQADEEKITSIIAKGKREGRDTTAEQIQLLEIQKVLGPLLTQQALDRAVAEGKITKEMAEQLALTLKSLNATKDLISTVKNVYGRDDKDLTDRQLEEKAGNLKKNLAIANQQNNGMQVTFAKDLENALWEIGRRGAFRSEYARQGEKAFLNFSAFDEQTLRNYIRPEDQRLATQSQQALIELNQRVGNSGLFPLRTPAPTG